MDERENEKEVGNLLKEIRNEIDEAIAKGTYFSITENEKNIFTLGPQLTQRSLSTNKILSDHFEKTQTFDNINATQSIDDDIKKLRIELKKSYDLFTTTRDALDSICFDKLRHRFKDLQIYASQNEINDIVGDRSIHDNLDKMTEFMADKFKNHPGEFGDIPEISKFFRVCSQLENGLKNLTNQKADFEELTKQIQNATFLSDDRSIEIQKILRAAEEETDPKKKLNLLTETVL